MTKAKLTALVCPLAFLLFGIYIRVATMSMTSRDATFPNLVSYVIIMISIIDCVSVWRKKEHKPVFAGVNFLKLFECVAAMCIYVFLLKKIGFIIDTFLLTSFTMYALDYKNWKLLPIISAAITAAVFGVFYGLLNVPLPTIFL